MPSKSAAKSASTPKRDLLLDTADRLFYADGFHAVGIDTILAEAGLAKMTLYHHFASKEELIEAALERRGEKISASLVAAIAAAGPSPRKQLLAVFDWHEQWFRTKDFRGCAFIRAAGEYAEETSPIHQAVQRQKARGRQAIEGILQAMELPHAAALALQIHLLLQGAIVLAHVNDDPSVIGPAREAALALVKAAEAKAGTR